MRELFLLRLGDLKGILAVTGAGIPFLALSLFTLDRLGWPGIQMTPSRRSLRTDFGYVVLGPFSELIGRILTTLAVVVCAVALGRHVGPDLLTGFGPVVKQPRWAVLGEMLVIHDFLYYWVHRAAHTVPWLWRLHAVHHSTRHLRWSSALRAHPGEIYLHIATTIPFFLLGFPVDALVPLTPLFTLYAILIHTNRKVALRRLSYVVNTPLFHGWHHALEVKNGGTNFAGLFPVFDAMFGTYQVPDHLPTEVGIDDAEMPETLLAQLRYPFRRRSTSLAIPNHETASANSDPPGPILPGPALMPSLEYCAQEVRE